MGTVCVVTRVHDNASGAPRCIQGQHRLNGHVHGWGIEGFKHYLRHLLSVSFGVREASVSITRCSSGATGRRYGVRSSPCHPVSDNAMLQDQETLPALGLITHGGIFLDYTHHDALVLAEPDGEREHGPKGVVSIKASFDHTKAIVNDQCSYFFFHWDLRGPDEGAAERSTV